jgi:hypothetical protein
VARVSENELRHIVEARSTEQLMPYIDDASLIVDETLVPGAGHSEERLKLIEKYLAAHFWVVAQEKGGYTSEKRGDASATYAKYEGKGLSSTRFGQQAANIDTSGELDKALSGLRKAQFRLV